MWLLIQPSVPWGCSELDTDGLREMVNVLYRKASRSVLGYEGLRLWMILRSL